MVEKVFIDSLLLMPTDDFRRILKTSSHLAWNDPALDVNRMRRPANRRQFQRKTHRPHDAHAPGDLERPRRPIRREVPLAMRVKMDGGFRAMVSLGVAGTSGRQPEIAVRSAPPG